MLDQGATRFWEMREMSRGTDEKLSKLGNHNRAMTDETAVTAECSKCEGQLDTTGYPKWCKSCRAKNKREYEATKKEMSETRGFAAGVSAMRQLLCDELRGRGPAMYKASDLYNWARTCKGPELPA